MHLFCYYPSLALCALKSSKEKKNKQTKRISYVTFVSRTKITNFNIQVNRPF